MQPSSKARDGPAPVAPGRTLLRTLLLAGLAGLTLLAFSSPASALMVQPRVSTMWVAGVGVGVGVNPYDASNPVFLQACFSHEAWWGKLPRAGPDDENPGSFAVWVPSPEDSSDGSTKATTACASIPSDGSGVPVPYPGVYGLPVGVQLT